MYPNNHSYHPPKRDGAGSKGSYSNSYSGYREGGGSKKGGSNFNKNNGAYSKGGGGYGGGYHNNKGGNINFK